VAVASAGLCANHLHFTVDRQPRHHLITQVFTDRMLFLTSNQQCQSTEGRCKSSYKNIKWKNGKKSNSEKPFYISPSAVWRSLWTHLWGLWLSVAGTCRHLSVPTPPALCRQQQHSTRSTGILLAQLYCLFLHSFCFDTTLYFQKVHFSILSFTLFVTSRSINSQHINYQTAL